MEDLGKLPLFERLSPDELSQLAGIVERRALGADVVVFFEEDPSDSLYVLVSGSAKVYRTAGDGVEQIVSTLVAGDLFGEYSMLDGEPRSATVATLEPSRILSISHRNFRDLVARSPAVLWKVMESLTSRMRRQNDALREMSLHDVPHRLLKTLGELARKHGEPVEAGTRLKIVLGTRDLAGMVGSTSERVGRLLQRFEAAGLISRGEAAASGGDSRILIPDTAGLSRVLEYEQDWS